MSISDTSYGSGNYSNSTLTAFFDDRDDAEDAIARLRDLGISDASIRIVGGGETTGTSTTSTSSTSGRYEEKGFWDSVVDFFMPDEDRYTYAEGLRRGGYMVTVSGLTTSQYDEAVDILDDEGSVDLDERSATWRSEGWGGHSSWSTSSSGIGMGTGTGMMDAVGDAARSTYNAAERTVERAADAVTGATGLGATGAEAGMSTTTGSWSDTTSTMRGMGDEEVIPVVEEQLRVGKRDVNLGRVRVRSYVVEQPVSEEVRLREEHVHVERRPVDRAVGSGDVAFTDRTIEAEEHAEEAVISKDARVTEEISLRREAEERTETVSDTVRRTEVEVEDDRGVTGTSSSSTTTTSSTGSMNKR